MELYQIQDHDQSLQEWLCSCPLQRQLHPEHCYQVSTVSKVHPVSVWTRAVTLTWAGLTGDRELLYQRHGGVAVVVGVQDPPVWALSKENPVRKQNRYLELLKEHFVPTPHLREERVAQGEDPCDPTQNTGITGTSKKGNWMAGEGRGRETFMVHPLYNF